MGKTIFVWSDSSPTNFPGNYHCISSTSWFSRNTYCLNIGPRSLGCYLLTTSWLITAERSSYQGVLTCHYTSVLLGTVSFSSISVDRTKTLVVPAFTTVGASILVSCCKKQTLGFQIYQGSQERIPRFFEWLKILKQYSVHVNIIQRDVYMFL